MIIPLFILSLATCIAGKQPLNCSGLAMSRTIPGSEKYVKAKGDKFADFDWELSKELNEVAKGNIVISPISLKVVLAMLNEGAQGETAREIRDALGLSNISTAMPRTNTRERFSTILHSLQTSKGEYEIKIGTHVFIDKNAQPKELYQCKLQMFYNSDMEKVDFSDSKAAVRVINNWAKNVTEGHIQDLISEAEAHSSTIMMLLNAVYFKGLWEMPFPENQTKEGLFHLDEKRSVKVPLMNTTDKFEYYDVEDFNAQLIKLPYLGGKFAMFVLLPRSKDGLNSIISALGPDRPLTDYLRNMRSTTVNLIMPKFEFDFTISLRSTLEELDIKRIFTTAAELTDIAETKSGSLVVSNVLQKAGISVTEIGTVAYAATVVELMDKFGGGQEVVEFKADHPFLFFIEDQTVNTTVFVGKVTNPGNAKVVENKINVPEETTPEEPVQTTAQPTACTGAICKPTAATTRPEDNITVDEEAVQERFNYFDADLLKELANQESGNFLVSPASIKTLLTLLVEGAEGSTLSELQRLLRLPRNINQTRWVLSTLHNSLQETPGTKVTIDSVSHGFFSKALTANTTYTKTIQDFYKTDVTPLDFSAPDIAANYINSWVNTRTRGLISNLIDPAMIHADTFALLTSAVYFDGKWKTEFMPGQTIDGCFYSEPNAPCLMVPMMSKIEKLQYKYDQTLDSHVLNIPYKDDRFSMVIVLPYSKDGMKQLTTDAARLSFPGVLKNLNLYEVNLRMPRFSMEYRSDLIGALKKMGVAEVFSNQAHLPYIVNQMARVSAMVHKAKIEVSEKGTKAAAASGASVVPLMYGLDEINLEINRPFYYFLYKQDSKTVLFAGRLSTVEGLQEREISSESNSGGVSPQRRPPAGTYSAQGFPQRHPPSEAESMGSESNGMHNYRYTTFSPPPRRVQPNPTYPKEPIQFPNTSNNRNYDKYVHNSNNRN